MALRRQDDNSLRNINKSIVALTNKRHKHYENLLQEMKHAV